MTVKNRPIHSLSIRTSIFAAVPAAIAIAASPLYAVDATWDLGASGNWSVDSNWSGDVEPVDNTFDVFIDGGDVGTDVIVSLDVTRTINNLTIDGGDTLGINNGVSLTLADLTNNGQLLINGTTSSSTLIFGSGSMLTGTGRVSLTNDPQSRITGSGNPTITNDAGHTIGGGGTFLANTASFINNGIIIADGSIAMVIDPDANGFTNNGTMQATSTAGLDLINSTYTNTSTIEALAGSRVDISGASVIGGTLSSTGTGRINFVGTTSLDGVTLATGTVVNQNNGVSVTATSGLTNNGTWNSLGTSSNTDLTFSGSQMLDGTGEFIFNADPQSRIIGVGNPLITHAATHTIRGGGTLLANTASMVNNGTILADSDTRFLLLDPDANGFVNNNILRATGTQGLILQNGIFTNNTEIEALDGSRIDITGSTLIGGTLSSVGSSKITFTGTSTLNSVTLATGTVVNQNNGVSVTVTNGLTNNGTWNNLGTSSSTDLTFSGSQTLDGTGEFIFNDDPQSRIIGSGNPLITHAATHTIRGGGDFLENTASMVNDGTILADSDTRVLLIDPDANGFVNNNILRATGTQGLILQNGIFTNNTEIEALDGSRIDITGSTLIGGTLSSVGSSKITFTGTSTLNSVTLATGTVVNQNNGVSVTVTNGLTNNGTWNNLGTSSSTDLTFSGSQTLDGTGEFIFNDDPQSRIIGSGNPLITHAATHTIRGGGDFLENTASMVNDGTILADSDTRVLLIDPDANGLTNNHILRATGTAGMELINSTFNITTSVDAMDGSFVNFSGATVVGGLLTTEGTGEINFTGTSTVNAVTIDDGARVDQNNGVSVTVVGGLTNNGTLNNFGSTSSSDLVFSGSQTIGGTGELVLNNDPQSRIIGTGNPAITNGASHTIRGGGDVLENTASMINDGTMRNSSTVPMKIDPDANGFVNNGLLLAEGDGVISFLAGGLTNTVNALIAGDGTVNVSAISFTNDGGIAPGMSPGVLDLVGNYSESSTATLFIEIAGTAVGDDYDQLAITGNAALAGTLNIDLLGFVPAPTDTFTILTAASVSGMYSNAIGTVTTVEGHLFDVTYNAGSVVLGNFVAVPEPAAGMLLAAGAFGLVRRRSS